MIFICQSTNVGSFLMYTGLYTCRLYEMSLEEEMQNRRRTTNHNNMQWLLSLMTDGCII